MKTIIALLTLCFAVVSSKAQDNPNPFAKYGYDVEYLTLSKGKYNEFHDQDTIVRIGNAYYNTLSKKLVGFVETDTIYSEADLQPEIISRWLSPDPLTSEYPSWSPYNYVIDNPILFIDPDGKDVIIKDVTSYRAVLGTLTSDEINRINIDENGLLTISGTETGSKNLENLRILVDSKVKHNILTSETYESAGGTQKLSEFSSGGRYVIPKNEANEYTGATDAQLSPNDNEALIVIRPTDDKGASEVVAHEAYGHGVLAEKRRLGDKSINPFHEYDEAGREQNENFKNQGWGAVSEARKNYKANSADENWKKSLSAKETEYISKVEGKSKVQNK